MPRAHTTGAANVSCNAWAVSGVSGALQLRMKGTADPLVSGLQVLWRSIRIWWIVGTAVYQVAETASTSSQNVCAENRPRAGSSTAPPDARVDSNPAISP